jgi:hypothetical protein
MKKCTLIILIIVLALLLHMDCDFDVGGIGSVGGFNAPTERLNVRNMSTLSGVLVYLEPQFDGELGVHLFNPSPDSGIPVDGCVTVYADSTYNCWVRRQTDSVTIDSVAVVFYCEKWLLIKTVYGYWNCTWSNSGW